MRVFILAVNTRCWERRRAVRNVPNVTKRALKLSSERDGS